MTGIDPNLPKKPDKHPSYCSFCFMANEWQLKYNSGSPRWFALPQCFCAEERTEKMIEERFKNRKQREQD